MRDRREELLFHLVDAPQTRRHGVEGLGEVRDLVPAAEGEGLVERARAHVLRRHRQRAQRARQAVRDPRGTGEPEHDGGAQRRQDPAPRALFEAGGFRLRGQHRRLTGCRPGLDARVHALDQRAAFAFRELEGSLAPPRTQERLLARHHAAVRLEVREHLGEDRRGVLRHPVAAETLQVVESSRGAVLPQRLVARITQHEVPRLDASEREQPVAHGGAHAQSGHGLCGDLAVDGHQSADGTEAQRADAAEDDDDRRTHEEDLRAELHVNSRAPGLTPRPLGCTRRDAIMASIRSRPGSPSAAGSAARTRGRTRRRSRTSRGTPPWDRRVRPPRSHPSTARREPPRETPA